MIGPVSGTGRAMMSSLQQAIAKGMPPDQAVQYVKSMATQGVAPLADLYAMMNQFQRLKQQQTQAPQTPPTIKDQLNALDQQQQMPQQGGIAQLQAAPPQGQPMDRGLGAIDAGLMEYPQFAGGGIVAFAEGGTAGIDFSKMSIDQLEMLAQGDDVDLARAALRERLRRSGYQTPSELGRKILSGAENVAERILSPATGRFPEGFDINIAGGAPAYMKDEQGRIRTPASQAGASAVTSSFTEGVVPFNAPPAPAPEAAATQSSVPGMSAVNPYAAPTTGSSPEDFAAMLGRAQTGVRQDVPQPPPAPRREAATPSMGGFKRAELPVAKSRDQFYEELTAAQKKEGIGEAARKREEYLTNEEARLKKEYGSDKMLAFAEAGFKMAGAASRPGATFFGALAEGAMSGTQALRALNKEQRASRRAMDEARFQLAEAAEQRKLGNMKDATILADKARDRYDKALQYNMELENDIEKLRITTGTQLKAAEIASGERAESRALAGKNLQLEGLRAQISTAQKRLAQVSGSIEADVVKARKIAEIEREIAFYNSEISKLGGTPAYSGTMGSESAIPPAVLQALNKYR